MKTVPIGIVQMAAAPFAAEPARARTLDLAAKAIEAGARLVVLPELAVPGYTLDPRIAEAAEPADGPTVAAWHRLAASSGVVIAGGFCERDGGKIYNTAVLVGPNGLLLHYRKLHLFDREKLVFARGDRGLAVADTPLGRIGLCVCYDLRFVEVLRVLALRDAEIVAVPTAWVGGFDRRTRPADGIIGQARGAVLQANLDQVYVACASAAGEAGGIGFLGSSLVADPYGELLAGPFGPDEERIEVVSADLDAVRAAQARSELIRPRSDRRTDVYGLRLGTEVL
jgi:predicted amidohydrolase